ncbi:hypothetical protein EX30DRAFT_338964 [Ascodesmis nigricans]|uniref:Biogenesis of lysosome-related organelles complex 1 subunit CNL1 n=1 Tax=Ascodesmis nigricans TaxID=341454 RepID=A0A4S2N0T5_9PEZI|nr:hypothetical protein EX30DRAFT_338964 [Ascodesmis nigricans]
MSHHHSSYHTFGEPEQEYDQPTSEDLHYIAQTQRQLLHHGDHRHHEAPLSPSSLSSQQSSRDGGGGAMLSLDPQVLAQLSAHFDGLLNSIAERVEFLSTQTLQSTQSHRRRTQLVTDHVTLEIERLKDVMRQCDELQNEFLKIKRIGEIVKGFRQRVEVLEKRVGR